MFLFGAVFDDSEKLLFRIDALLVSTIKLLLDFFKADFVDGACFNFFNLFNSVFRISSLTETIIYIKQYN